MTVVLGFMRWWFETTPRCLNRMWMGPFGREDYLDDWELGTRVWCAWEEVGEL